MYVTANLQSTASIPCGSKLVGLDDMFPRQSHMQMIQAGAWAPMQVWGLLGGMVRYLSVRETLYFNVDLLLLCSVPLHCIGTC